MGGPSRVRLVAVALATAATVAACSGSGEKAAVTTIAANSTTAAPATTATTAPASATTAGGGPATTAPAGPPGPVAVALDVATGEQRWSAPTPERAVGGQVSGGVLVVRSCSPGSVSAADATTGAVRWTASAACTEGPAVWIGGDVVVTDTTDGLVGLALATGAQKWKVGAPSPPGPSSIAGSGDVVVALTGSSGVIAVDRTTGAERWQAAGPAGLLSLVVAGPVVVAATSSEVVALDLATGATRWRRAVSAPGGPPVGAGSLVVVTDVGLGTAPPTTTGAELPHGALVALDAATGAERWRYEPTGEGGGLPSGTAAFDATSSTIVAGWATPEGAAGYSVEGIGLDGKLRWRAPGLLPVAAVDGVAVVSTAPDQGSLAVKGLDAATGKERWTSSPPIGSVLGAVGGSGIVVVAGTGPGGEPPGAAAPSRIDALAPADGTRLWTTTVEGVVSGVPPAITAGVAAVVSCPSSGATKIVAVDLASGKDRWERAGPGCGAAGIVPLAVIGDGVLAAPADAGVVALDAKDGADRWTAPVSGPVIWLAGDAQGLVAFTDGRLVGLDPASGKQRWQLDVGLGSQPSTVGSGIVVVGEVKVSDTPSVTMTAYDLLTGAPRWHADLPALDAQAVVAGDVAVVSYTATNPSTPLATGSAALVGLDVRSGAERWHRTDLGPPFGPPVVDRSTNDLVSTFVAADAAQPEPSVQAVQTDGRTRWTAAGLVVLAAGGGLVLATTFDGASLVGLDTRTGTERWRSSGEAGPSAASVTEQAAVAVFTPGGTD